MGADAKHVVSEFVSIVDRGDIGKIDDVIASTFVDHHPWPGHPGTLSGFRAGLLEFRTAFPDARSSIDAIELDGETASVLITWIGTHLGPFKGNKPSGRTFRVQVLEILRIEGGLVTERWGFFDDEMWGREMGDERNVSP